MRLAFYAPMKPPDDPLPSGDRTIARNLLAALAHLGAEAELASRFRSRDGRGDRAVQAALIAGAEQECKAVIDRGRAAGWQAWITYHNYYKAPDLIGPAASRALGIPYLQVESTRARKRLEGPWAAFAARAEAATDSAQVVFPLSERDAEALRRDAPEGQSLLPLRPFLARSSLPPATSGGAGILAVGMMRAGDKLASYRLIAEALALLKGDWQLEIAGDGPARPEVAALMAPFGDRVRLLGALDPEGLAEAFGRAGIFLWPGVNEALGMVYLEAQAACLAVVAQDRPGMREVLAPGRYPAEAAGAVGLAALLAEHIGDVTARRASGSAGRAHVAAHHLLPRAAETLAQGLALAGVSA